MSEVIGRVAQAIYEGGRDSLQGRNLPTSGPWEELSSSSRWAWMAAARAAIEAMRERDEAMLDAGTAVLWPYAQKMVSGPGSVAVAVWGAMIDASLKD